MTDFGAIPLLKPIPGHITWPRFFGCCLVTFVGSGLNCLLQQKSGGFFFVLIHLHLYQSQMTPKSHGFNSSPHFPLGFHTGHHSTSTAIWMASAVGRVLETIDGQIENRKPEAKQAKHHFECTGQRWSKYVYIFCWIFWGMVFIFAPKKNRRQTNQTRKMLHQRSLLHITSMSLSENGVPFASPNGRPWHLGRPNPHSQRVLRDRLGSHPCTWPNPRPAGPGGKTGKTWAENGGNNGATKKCYKIILVLNRSKCRW